MEIKTTKSIKIESSRWRKIYYDEPCEDTKHDFNEFQFKKWVAVDDVISEMKDYLGISDERAMFKAFEILKDTLSKTKRSRK